MLIRNQFFSLIFGPVYFFRFGARAAGLQSSVMILRILRDLQAWSPHWKSLKNFALELIVEKSLASVGLPLSPGDALRRVFEAISGMQENQLFLIKFSFLVAILSQKAKFFRDWFCEKPRLIKPNKFRKLSELKPPQLSERNLGENQIKSFSSCFQMLQSKMI